MALQRRYHPTPDRPLNYWKYCLSQISDPRVDLDLVSFYWKQGLSSRLTGFELCRYTIDSLTRFHQSRYQPYQSRSTRTNQTNIDEIEQWLRQVQITEPSFNLEDLSQRFANL